MHDGKSFQVEAEAKGRFKVFFSFAKVMGKTCNAGSQFASDEMDPCQKGWSLQIIFWLDPGQMKTSAC